MTDKPAGIHNPFAKPKKDIRTPLNSPGSTQQHEGPLDAPVPEPSITLDGESYGIEFENTTIETVKTRLIELFKTVSKTHAQDLAREGIVFDEDKIPEENLTLILNSPGGSLSVWVGNELTEIAVFRRLGYALNKLPVREILKKHKVKLRRMG